MTTHKHVLMICCALLVLLVPGDLLAKDINNPVLFYQLQQSASGAGQRDSILVGKAFFDPLPEFGRESQITLEHYAQFACPTGIVISAYGTAVMNGALSFADYAIESSQSVSRGDTVFAVFFVTPKQIGVLSLGFSFLENLEVTQDRPPRSGGGGDASFLLMPDGTTAGLGSPEVSTYGASVLGPLPILFDRGLVYQSHWKDTPSQHDPGNSNSDNMVPHRFFAVRVEVELREGQDNRLFCRCLVSPYYSSDKGIGFTIAHKGGVIANELTPCIAGSVDSSQVYEFACELSLVTPGIHAVGVSFETLNPDYRQSEGTFARIPSQVLGGGVRLYIGVDDGGELVFITDKEPQTSLEILQRQGVDPVVIDSRYSLVGSLPRSSGRLQTVHGDGYDDIVKKVRQGRGRN